MPFYMCALVEGKEGRFCVCALGEESGGEREWLPNRISCGHS